MKFDDHFIAWAFIYSIGAYLSIKSWEYLDLGGLVGLFIAGIIITSLSFIMYSFLYKNRFKLNKWFFIWFFTNTFDFWWIDLALRKLSMTYDGFFYFLLFGLIYSLITWLIKHKVYYKIRVDTKKAIIIPLVFIILLLSVSSQPFSEIKEIGKGGNSSLSVSLSSIKNLLSGFSFGNSCPQLDIPILEQQKGTNLPLLYYIDGSNPQKGWEIGIYSTAEAFGILGALGIKTLIYCHKGDREGENPLYYYCDSGLNMGKIPYITKTTINSDGTIGKTTVKSFINVYDENKRFIKTICGPPPGDIIEADFKKEMRELDKLFSLD